MAPEPIRRKKYIIAYGFQFKYIGYILLFLYVGALVAGYTVYYTTWVTLGEKLANVYPTGRLLYIFRSANMTLLVRLLLITPLFVVIGVVLSHRIAGPIYRIGLYVEALKKGDYSRALALRKRDEFKPLAQKMSELCYVLREEREKKDQIIDQVVSVIDRENLSPSAKAQIKGKLNELKSAVLPNAPESKFQEEKTEEEAPQETPREAPPEGETGG